MLAPQFRWWASLVGGDGSGWDVGGEMWDKVGRRGVCEQQPADGIAGRAEQAVAVVV